MAKDPSRTEKATPKRLNKARGEGNVAKSQDVSKTVSILAGLIALTFWIGYIAKDMMALYRYFLSSAPSIEINDSNLSAMGFWLAGEIAKMVMPVMLFIGFSAYICLRMQVGKLWSTKVFKPKLSRFNPISGLKRMFLSVQTFIRLGKSLLQAFFIGIAPWMVIKSEMAVFPTLYDMDAAGVATYILTIGSKMVKYALIPMVGIAVFDFWYTRHDYAENLKMTKSEVKDEHKQAEGDPQVKGKMRQKMMQIVMRQMMREVPKADVVITNPTHIAVALRYDSAKGDSAPVVVAMGVNKVAERIKEIARENKVPIRENKPLARALYKHTQIGDAIPADLFQAVAAILAQIWKTRPRSNVGKSS